MQFNSLANPGVQKLTPYQPGKPIEELQRELGLKEIVKLASNENPLGPSPLALKAISGCFGELARYPDGNAFRLKHALAEKLAVDPVQITLGNGSNDILEFVPKVFANVSSEIVISQYAFAVYALATLAVGAKPVVVPAKNYAHDLQAMAAAFTPATRVVFIANPNNPTGTWINEQALVEFMEKTPPDVVVVLDEAYCEYVRKEDYPNGLDYLQRFPNLIVTRTFSKVWGLAGLRIGYAICHPDIADLMNRVRQPFNVNLLAQEAALAVLQDEVHLEKSILLNHSGIQQLTQGFAKLGLSWIPSLGNFVSFEAGRDASEIYHSLLAKGVIVRPLANYEMPEYLRVSVGLEQENTKFLSALNEILQVKGTIKS